MKVALSHLCNVTRNHAALWIVILSIGGLAFGDSPKISPDLQGVDAHSTVNVIVQYYNPPTSDELNTASAVSGGNGKKLGIVKAYSLKTSSAHLQNLIQQDPNIKYVSLDRPLKAAMDLAVPTVNADVAHALGYDGTGVGVAVIDSGVNQVADLNSPYLKTSRIVYSQNFDPSANTTSDLYGHGTHVAGIVAGNGANSLCSNCDVAFRGIAPNANIINLRVLDVNGTATDSTVISAIQQAIALKSQYNIRIINLSLGRGIFESYKLDPLCQAVEQAWQAGIVVVVAAGNYGRDNSNANYGYGTITAPGNDPYVITVGAMKTMGTATRADDLIATYSSKGPTMLDQIIKPDIVAPGNLIKSDLASTSATLFTTNYPQNAVPIAYYTTNNNQNASSSYFSLSGTSMAAPMVSGASALLLQQNPSLTPDQIKARLMKTAYKTFPASSSYTDPSTGITYTDYYDIFTIGAGYLDVWAALNNSDLAPGTAGSALSPTAIFNTVTNQVYMSNSSSVIWGGSSTWSTSVVWGTAVIWGTTTSGQSVLWGSATACWDNTTSTGFSLIWDEHALWGHSSTSADSVLTGTE